MVLNHLADGLDDTGPVPGEVAVLRTVEACGCRMGPVQHGVLRAGTQIGRCCLIRVQQIEIVCFRHGPTGRQQR
ncbi:hypothetical protein ACIPRL_34965 [Streptomyces sp. NPDC090085]|uniref:hypothetical protein n=1 Tax=Streptomyces sp. NPDC090085 TaxID=3365943 RepID=UPI0037F1045D